MRRRDLGSVGAVGLLALVAAVGCSSGGGDATPPGPTVPSSLTAPSTSAAGATTTTVPTSTAPTAVQVQGAPVLRSLSAAPGAAACTGGTIPVVVTFDAEPDPPVRVFTVILDGTPAGSSNTATPITVGPIACDGALHSVLLIATGTDQRSATDSVAFRAPGPG